MEVALAATVLALTLVGMIQVIDSGSEMLDVSRKQTIATQILQDEIDQVHLTNWNTLIGWIALPMPTDISGDSTFLSFAQQLNPTIVETFPFTNFPYSGTRTISVIQMSPPLGGSPVLLQVVYTVKWTGITGHTYVRQATTYVGKNGLSTAYQRS